MRHEIVAAGKKVKTGLAGLDTECATITAALVDAESELALALKYAVLRYPTPQQH